MQIDGGEGVLLIIKNYTGDILNFETATELLHIGQGMLSGACPGEIFTSPTPDKMFECAMQIDGGEGVLLIIKNYTGDILNFETATELLH
ncbi:hypothetical protein CP989_25070, partial [Enterobacter hormaechei]